MDKDLLPMKAHYFFYNAATAPVVPFMPTLARQMGFSSVIVGIIYTILPIIGLLAKPMFGFIADRYQRHRMLFLMSEVLTAVAFFLIMFIPNSGKESMPRLQFHCHEGFSVLRYCSAIDNCIAGSLQENLNNQTINCKLHCDGRPYMWKAVCENWLKMDMQECLKAYNTSNSNLLEFEVDINMDKLFVEKQCLFFTILHNRANFTSTSSSSAVTMNCSSNLPYFNASCLLDCNNNYLNSELHQLRVIPKEEALGMFQFWMFFALLIISWIGMAVTVSIGDAFCFSILGERHHLYGRQRLYGSIGYGLFAIIAGLLVDSFSAGSATKDYTIVFWMCAIIYGFDVFASAKLKQTHTQTSTTMIRDIGRMFLHIRCIVFFAWCICIGLFTALIWNFLLWYLEEIGSVGAKCQNSIKTLEGIVLAIQSFGGELPFFFISGWVLKKIGHERTMSLVILAFAVRFTCYAWLSNPWLVLPVELLHGVTSGIFYATMASYANIIAPLGAEATIQGFVGAIFEGVGASIGSLVGGILFESVGGSATFAYFALVALGAFLIHVFLQWCMKSYGIFDTSKRPVVMTNTSTDTSSQSSLASFQTQ